MPSDNDTETAANSAVGSGVGVGELDRDVDDLLTSSVGGEARGVHELPKGNRWIAFQSTHAHPIGPVGRSSAAAGQSPRSASSRSAALTAYPRTMLGASRANDTSSDAMISVAMVALKPTTNAMTNSATASARTR